MKMCLFHSLCYLSKVVSRCEGTAGKAIGLMHYPGQFHVPLLKVSCSFCGLHSSARGLVSHCSKSVSEPMLRGAKLICGSSANFQYSSRPLPALTMRIFHSSSHRLVRMEFLVEGIDDETSSNIKQISEDVEKVCRILSKEPNSSIGSSLDQSGVKVTPGFAVEVLKKLSNAGILALSFFRWAEKQQGFRHSTECYHQLIEALGKIKQFKLIWDLVSVMKDQKLLTKETFAVISRRYVRAKNIKEAVRTFERMRDFGVLADSSDLNRLLDTLCKSRNVKLAQELVVDMRRRKGFNPDLKTYTILLEGLGSTRDLARLTEVYQEMMSDGFEPDVVAYGILIHGFVKCRKVDEAIEIFHGMRARNLEPSAHIYCTLINELGAEKRLFEALKYFELSKSSGIAPDIPLYNAVVGAYCWVHQFENAYRILAEMKDSGLGPNARTYEVILHHLIKACRTEEAHLVFQRMSRESGCEPGLNTYSMIVRMFCNEEKLDMAIRIWQMMNEKGVLPCMHMYSVLINGLLGGNRQEEACEYFQEMLDRGIRPPGVLYGNLKHALVAVGKNDLAMHMGAELDRVRRTPLIG